MFHDTLEALCISTTSDVFSFLCDLGFELRKFKGRRYAFRPGANYTSPLAVCHADTVVRGGEVAHAFKRKGDKVTSIALDDRLGIACLVDAIDRKLPLSQCAMLICDEEEKGRSTASLFDESIEPNWMVELDRRGADAVAYDFETPLLCSLLTAVGFTIGKGSFSDICSLEHLRVIGFNIGVGYHQEHSERCHANLKDTFAQLERLDKFLAKFGDVRLDHAPYTPSGKDDYGWPSDRYDDLEFGFPGDDDADVDLMDADAYWKD